MTLKISAQALSSVKCYCNKPTELGSNSIDLYLLIPSLENWLLSQNRDNLRRNFLNFTYKGFSLVKQKKHLQLALVISISTVMWGKENKKQIPAAKFRFKAKWARKPAGYHKFTDAFWWEKNIFLWRLHSFVLSHCSCQLTFLQLKLHTFCIQCLSSKYLKLPCEHTNSAFQPSTKNNHSPKSPICHWERKMLSWFPALCIRH